MDAQLGQIFLKVISLLKMNGCYVLQLMGDNKNYLNEYNSIKLDRRMGKVILFI
jgi:hypothetical protein